MSALPFLEALIYGVRDIYSGNTPIVRKSQLQFRTGFTVTVIGDQIVVDTSGGGGGGGLPITNAGLTALDDVAVTGGRNLIIGADNALANAYKSITFAPTDAAEISPGGGLSVAVWTADGQQINNGKYLGFLSGTDPATLPPSGAMRLENGLKITGATSGGAACNLGYVDASDYATYGDTGGSYLQLKHGGSDAILVAGAYSWRLSGGTMVLSFPETINAGTTTGETKTREDATKTTAAPGTIATFVTAADSMSIIDVEVVGLKADGSIGMRAKLSIGVLNVGGTLSADTPDAPAPSFIGGAPGWTLAFNLADPNVTLDADPGADTVSWYVVSSKQRTVVIP